MSFIRLREIKRKGKKSNWIYYYYWRDQAGRQQAESLKTKSRTEAKVLMAKKDEKSLSEKKGIPYYGIDWKEFKQRFLNCYPTGRTREMHDDNLSLFEKFINPRYITDLITEDAEKYKTKLMSHVSKQTGRAWAHTTINMALKSIKCAFKWGLECSLLRKNIFSKVSLLDETKQLPRYRSKNEIEKLKATSLNFSLCPDLYDMLLVYLNTAMRRGELVSLKWEHIDFERQVIRVARSERYRRGETTEKILESISEPKNRREREIGIAECLLPILKSRKERATSEYVFPGKTGGERDKSAVDKLFKRLYNRAEVKAGGTHTLRHSYAMHSNLDIETLQHVLGHAEIKTTQIYKKLREDQLRAIKAVNI